MRKPVLLSPHDVAVHAAAHLGLGPTKSVVRSTAGAHILATTSLLIDLTDKRITSILQHHGFTWCEWSEEWGAGHRMDLAELTCSHLDSGQSAWKFQDKQEELIFSIQINCTSPKRELRLSPWFLDQSTSSKTDAGHELLFSVLFQYGPEDIRTKLKQLLPTSRAVTLQDIGLTDALWASELFAKHFDTTEYNHRLARLLNTGDLDRTIFTQFPRPFSDQALVPVESQQKVLALWRRQVRTWVRKLPGLQTKRHASV